MQRINTFFYGIGQGIKSIFRNKMFSLASVCTMAACLFLFGIFYTVLTNFEYMVKSAETNVGITIFFEDDATDAQIAAIGDKLLARAEVHQVAFTSAEDAWKDYKETRLSPELAETFGDDNPLEHSASYTVYLNDVTMQESLVKYVKGLDGVRKVNDSKDIAESLAGLNKVITAISVSVIVILLAVAAFLISITVSTGVSVRKQEISIMKLIGASDFFIRIPFTVEGVIIGLVGAVIPLVVVRLTYSKIVIIMEEKFSSVFSIVSFLGVSDVMKTLIPVSLLIGIGIGFIGSKATLRRQLRKIDVG